MVPVWLAKFTIREINDSWAWPYGELGTSIAAFLQIPGTISMRRECAGGE
jgi:hypothetical protein